MDTLVLRVVPGVDVCPSFRDKGNRGRRGSDRPASIIAMPVLDAVDWPGNGGHDVNKEVALTLSCSLLQEDGDEGIQEKKKEESGRFPSFRARMLVYSVVLFSAPLVCGDLYAQTSTWGLRRQRDEVSHYPSSLYYFSLTKLNDDHFGVAFWASRKFERILGRAGHALSRSTGFVDVKDITLFCSASRRQGRRDEKTPPRRLSKTKFG